MPKSKKSHKKSKKSHAVGLPPPPSDLVKYEITPAINYHGSINHPRHHPGTTFHPERHAYMGVHYHRRHKKHHTSSSSSSSSESSSDSSSSSSESSSSDSSSSSSSSSSSEEESSNYSTSSSEEEEKMPKPSKMQPPLMDMIENSDMGQMSSSTHKKKHKKPHKKPMQNSSSSCNKHGGMRTNKKTKAVSQTPTAAPKPIPVSVGDKNDWDVTELQIQMNGTPSLIDRLASQDEFGRVRLAVDNSCITIKSTTSPDIAKKLRQLMYGAGNQEEGNEQTPSAAKRGDGSDDSGDGEDVPDTRANQKSELIGKITVVNPQSNFPHDIIVNLPNLNVPGAITPEHDKPGFTHIIHAGTAPNTTAETTIKTTGLNEDMVNYHKTYPKYGSVQDMKDPSVFRVDGKNKVKVAYSADKPHPVVDAVLKMRKEMQLNKDTQKADDKRNIVKKSEDDKDTVIMYKSTFDKTLKNMMKDPQFQTKLNILSDIGNPVAYVTPVRPKGDIGYAVARSAPKSTTGNVAQKTSSSKKKKDVNAFLQQNNTTSASKRAKSKEPEIDDDEVGTEGESLQFNSWSSAPKIDNNGTYSASMVLRIQSIPTDRVKSVFQ